MTVKTLDKIKELISRAVFVQIENLAESISAVKDNSEINKIKKAVKITDTAFSRILKMTKPGVKERDLALELSYMMIKSGADGPAFDFIVASGQRSSMPHGKASDRKLKKGDFVTFDIGCFYAGYASDMTRTIVLGKASEKQKKIYNTVLKAQIAAIDAARSGISGKELDSIARDYYKQGGVRRLFWPWPRTWPGPGGPQHSCRQSTQPGYTGRRQCSYNRARHLYSELGRSAN